MTVIHLGQQSSFLHKLKEGCPSFKPFGQPFCFDTSAKVIIWNCICQVQLDATQERDQYSGSL